MDWNLKSAAPIWDFTEFPPQETTTLPHGSSSASASQTEFSVDLKLGQVSNGGVVVSKETTEKAVGPTKRARGAVNNVGCQAVVSSSCLVDGCYADLSSSREYHRRHKVCEIHSKTPEVTIGGHKQRFCQQCSRFHSLEEFDEGKRSCRKRLEGHNRRRRKAQPDPLIRPPVVNCISNYQGTSRASPSCFSNTNHIYSSAAVGNQHLWLGGGEEAAAAALYNQQIHCFHNIPTLFGSSQTLPPSRGVLGSGSSSNHHNNNNNNNNEYYCEGQVKQQQDTDCALSLLSSPSPLMMQLGLHQGTPSSSSSSASSSSSSSATTHCNSLFDANSPPQTLPFHWD